MGMRSRIRFQQRTNRLNLNRAESYHRGTHQYGVECMYCNEYFPNARKPEWGGYICRDCK
jgi:hypothetical protein